MPTSLAAPDDTDGLTAWIARHAMEGASRARCDATGRHITLSDSSARPCGAEMIDLGAVPLRGGAAPQRPWTVAEA